MEVDQHSRLASEMGNKPNSKAVIGDTPATSEK